ncbi:MAG: hypothetical protein ABI591_02370 [Kofleriaceae bacterium]
MADRAQLDAWIAESRLTQHRLKVFLIPAVVAAIGVSVWSHALGALVFVSIGIVAVFGFWITAAHITDWEGQQHRIDHPPQPALTKDGRLRRERD